MKWWVILAFFSISLSWSWVFIFSDPLGADIFINQTHVGKTPYVLTNAPLSFSLTIAKPGYKSIKRSIRISGRITNLSYSLSSESFHVIFPGYEKVSIRNQVFEASEVENLVTGTYQFQVFSNTINIERINPNRPFLVFSLGVTAGGLLVGSIGLVLGAMEYEKFMSAPSYEEAVKRMQLSMFLDNLTFWGYSLAIVGGSVSIYFASQDMEFQRRSDQFVVKKMGYFGKDKQLYNEGMDFLSQQKNELAIQKFEQLVKEYPESLYTPYSLYQWGKILIDQRNNAKAKEVFISLFSKYPVLDLYEITLYELFRLESKQYNFSKAKEYLDILRSIQFLYSQEDIDWFEIELYREWSQKDPSQAHIYQQKKEAFIQTRSYDPQRRQILQTK